MLFDSLLGYTAFKLSGSRAQRTAFLHVDYRKIALVEKELQVDAGIDGIEDRKIFVSGRLLDGDAVLAEAARAVREAEARTAVKQDEDERPSIRRRWARWRDRLRERRDADFVYRIVVGVVGLAVLGVGILAIPYPGPGWAIVFVGLAILATEFDWARRLLAYAQGALRQGDGLVQRPGTSRCRRSACVFTGADRAWPRCGCSARSTGRRSWSASSGHG